MCKTVKIEYTKKKKRNKYLAVRHLKPLRHSKYSCRQNITNNSAIHDEVVRRPGKHARTPVKIEGAKIEADINTVGHADILNKYTLAD